ncbi:MAG: hypothetical protein WBV55_10510 [Candidatus Sulfotelmatobacter sp.]
MQKARIFRQHQLTFVIAEFLPQEEIGFRLFGIPAFRTFAEQLGDRIAKELSY